MLRNPGLRKSVEQPVLDLNFAASQIGSNGAPDSRIDFSRGNNAWFVDSDGLVKKSPHNLVLNSQSIENGVGGWSVSSTTESSLEAPDGLDGSTKITFAGIDQVYVLVSVEAGQEYRFSYYVKLGTKPNNRYAIYDHTNGSFIVSSSVVSGVSSDEWTRVNFTVTAPSGCTSIRFYVDRSDTVNTENGTTFITGVQVSQHTTLPVGNPYIKTEGSAVYAARLDHDPTWFMSAAQEQNLLEYSEMLDDSAWTKTILNVTANAETDPLGGTTAEYLYASSPSGVYPFIQGSFDAKKGAVHTVSFYAKAGEIDIVTINIRKPDGTYISAPIENQSLTSEWQRFSGTFTANEDSHIIRLYFGSGAKTWSGDQGFYIWGTQIEVGSTASTYHRTEGAPYYGPGATPKGLLIEEARTNLLPESEAMTASNGFTNTNLTVTANAALAPDGTVTAHNYDNQSGGVTALMTKNITVSASSTNDYYATFFAKKSGTNNTITFNVYYSGNSEDNVAFDLDTETITGAPSDAFMEDYGNGWYRCGYKITRDATGTRTLIGWRFWPQGRGNSSGSMYVWGGGLELGSFPTSYIQTTGTTLTRNADVATMGPTTGGTELVTNGTFDTDTTGWTLSSSAGVTASISSSGATLTCSTATGSALLYQDTQRTPTVIGRRYRASADFTVNSGDGVNLVAYSGSFSGGLGSANITSGSSTVSFDFTATTTSTQIAISRRSTFADTDEYVVDNISVRELYPFEQYNPAEGTYYVHSKRITDENVRFYILNPIADGVSPADQMYLWHWDGSATTVRWKIEDGGVASSDSTRTATLDADMRLAAPYKSNSAALALDGSASSTDTSVTVPPIDKIAFGYAEVAAAFFLNGHIKEVSYYARRLSNETLESLTDD